MRLNLLYSHVLSRFLSTFAFQLLSFFAFLEVFESTRSALNMAVVGLALYVPTFFLNFWSGAFVDRLVKKGRFYLVINALQMMVPILLLIWGKDVLGLLLSVFMISIFRALRSPLYYSVLSQIKEVSPNCQSGYLAKLNTLSWQVPLILSPVLVSSLPTVVENKNAVLFLILALQALAALFSFNGKSVCGKKGEGAKVLNLFSFYRDQAKNKKEVFVPLLVDSLLACFLGMNSFLPFLLTSHNLESHYFGLAKSAYHLVSIFLIIIFPKYGFKNTSLKNTAMFLFLWGGALLFIGLTESVVYLGLGIVLLGLLDGLSILYRENLIFKFTPANEMGRVSSANSFLVSTGDEFGEFSTGMMLGGLGLNMHIFLNFVLSVATGVYVLHLSRSESEQKKSHDLNSDNLNIGEVSGEEPLLRAE